MTTDKPMTMVERVARAIIIAECGGRVDSFSRSLLDGWKEWEDVARAAIEAMREPTDGMLRAVREEMASAVEDEIVGGEFSLWFIKEGAEKEVVVAAIDAALKE